MKSERVRIVVCFNKIPSYLGEPNLQQAIHARLGEAEKILKEAVDALGSVPSEMLATLPVFVMRHRLPDPDVAGRPASALLGPWVRQWAVWLLLPLERGLLRAGVSPDHLNALGLAGGVGGGIAFACGELMIAAWLIAAGGVCDILDGRIARAGGFASAAGAFLDSTLDRFGECATLLGLACYFRTSDALMLWTMAAL